jgi:hypothetical protein
MDEWTTRAGLLMEAAQSQQRAADQALRKLKQHAGELGAVVREEVRSVLTAELQALASDSRSAGEALRRLRRSAGVHLGLWSLGVTAVCTSIVLGLAWWTLPSRAEIESLRVRRDAYTRSLELLAGQGGRADVRRCGNDRRVCVRIDRQAATFGDSGDFMILKGY